MIGFECLKHMLDLAWKVNEAEREVDPWEPPEQAKAKFTKLFNEVRSNAPPSLVERIINDIYAGLRIVHFTGWQQTFDGEHQVIKALRRILRKYNLHLEQEMFDRIYEYLKQYY
jgi:type I restriction enzyme R subunit